MKPVLLLMGLLLVFTSLGQVGSLFAARSPHSQTAPLGNAHNIEFISNYDSSGVARSVTLNDAIAYLADGSAGLRVLDVSNPYFPTSTAFLSSLGDAWSVTVASGHVYVVTRDAGFYIVNSDHISPTLLGHYPIESGSGLDMEVVGNLAYVAARTTFDVVDVSNPAQPERVGRFGIQPDAQLNGIDVVGSYAYVAAGTAGVRIFDVSQLPTITEVGGIDTPGEAVGITIQGIYAYVSDREGGIRILDVSNVENPSEVGSYDTRGEPREVDFVGQYAYVADGTGGVLVLDVTTIPAPLEVGYYITPDHVQSIAVDGDLIYATNREAGLFILRFNPSSGSPTPTVTQTSTPRPTWDGKLFLPLVRRPPAPTPTPTQTATPTQTPTHTPSPTPSHTPTLVPSVTATTPPPSPTATSDVPPPPPPTPVPIINSSFEQGSFGWAQYSQRGQTNILHESNMPVPAYLGSWAVWLGGVPNEEAYVRQIIYVPVDRPYLHFWLWSDSNETSCNYDRTYLVIGATPLQRLLCRSTNTNGWDRHTFNLSSYAGQFILLEHSILTDGSVNSNFFVDHHLFLNTALLQDEEGSSSSVPLLVQGDGWILSSNPQPQEQIPQSNSAGPQ